MRVWIGTAGFSYSVWVGALYPPGTPQNRFLSHYAREFPFVEINNTFYRCPAPGQLARYAEQTPAGFRLTVKVPATITHERRPDELPPFRAAVGALQARDRLLGVLLQFPQSFPHTADHLAWLLGLAAELAEHRPAVEFRHRSWVRPGLAERLADHGLDLVSVDVPAIPALFPRGLVGAGPRRYLRLHSRRAATWYEGGRARYDYDYPDDALREWADALRGCGADEALVVFNNCAGTQAVDNARRFRQLLSERAPELEVMAAPAAPLPRQRSLFEG
jgi:uncharacterized protein YecE (DUF72 family)